MMKKSISIGLDFGSDSVRAIAVTPAGEVLAGASRNYPRWAAGQYCDPARNQYRQHPLDYLECMESVLNEVLDQIDRTAVTGVALDTTASTPCAVDRDGTPLALLPEFAENPNAMFILWKDHTAGTEAVRINEVASDYLKYEGGIYSCEWFWSKILHTLRIDAEVREAAFSWVEHCDWMTGELSGHTDPLTMTRSRCAAGHKAMWHADWGGLPPEAVLAEIDPLLAGLRQRLYTRTATADIPVGTLSPKWAGKLGLSTAVVIGGGAIDCHFGAVGAGIQPGQMIKVIGTSTCDILAAPGNIRCVQGICGQVDGSVVPGMIGLEAGQSAFGDIYAWFRRFISYGGEVSLDRLEEEALKLPPGAGGVAALDWFHGRRTPDANPDLTGLLAGLTLGTTPPMVYRALVEATVFGARAIVERFRAEGVAVDSVGAVGGISRKSPLVMQICADVLNMPIRVAANEQTCALGAAIFAALAAGVHPDYETAVRNMSSGYDRTYAPNAEHAAIYTDLYRRYCILGKAQERGN